MLLKKPQIARRQFSCCKKSDRRPPIRYGLNHVTEVAREFYLQTMRVPHIFTLKLRVQPREILITSAKRLFQQHRSNPAVISAVGLGLLYLSHRKFGGARRHFAFVPKGDIRGYITI